MRSGQNASPTQRALNFLQDNLRCRVISTGSSNVDFFGPIGLGVVANAQGWPSSSLIVCGRMAESVLVAQLAQNGRPVS
jgi:hypothetical protein